MADDWKTHEAHQELRQCVAAVGPTLEEFFDCYLVLGVRAGDPANAMHVMVADTEEDRLRVENVVLTIAAEIMRRREGGA